MDKTTTHLTHSSIMRVSLENRLFCDCVVIPVFLSPHFSLSKYIMVKRPASSTAGSPPPATSQPKPKKPRASKPKAPKKSKKDQSLSTPAGSPGASSPPPTAGSPPRGRSMSVVAGNEAEPNVKEKKKGKKGKEKAKDQDRDGEEEDGDGQQQQGEEGDQDAEDEVLVFSDDEVPFLSLNLALTIPTDARRSHRYSLGRMRKRLLNKKKI